MEQQIRLYLRFDDLCHFALIWPSRLTDRSSPHFAKERGGWGEKGGEGEGGGREREGGEREGGEFVCACVRACALVHVCVCACARRCVYVCLGVVLLVQMGC